MGAKATKAVAAQNMLRRADRMMAALDDERVADKVARIRFPTPGAVRPDPAGGQGPDQDLRLAGDLHRRRPGHRPRLPRRGARPQRRRQDHAAAAAGRASRQPDTGALEPGHGLKIGYFAQEHDTLDDLATVWENIRHAAPDTGEQDLRGLLGAFMFTGPQLDQPAGTLSGGEKTRLALAGLVASTANVLLLDEPTNNLDPASREQVLDALRSYAGAVVLVTHDPGAAEALDPQRVILLPDGTEDLWSDGLPGSHRAGLSRHRARRFIDSARFGVNGFSTLGMRRGINSGEMSMKKLNKSRDQLLNELRQRVRGRGEHPHPCGVHRPLLRFDPQHAA